MTPVGPLPLYKNHQNKFSTLLNAAAELNMTVPITMGFLSFLGSSRTLLVDESLKSFISNQFVGPFFFSLTMALYVAIPLVVATQLRIGLTPRFDGSAYFVLAVLVSNACTFVLVKVSFQSTWLFVFGHSVRLLILTLLVALVVGQYKKAVSAELSVIQTMESLARAEQQPRLLIQSDERVRREIADFMHDSLQSKLVVAATKLKTIQRKIPDSFASEFNSVLSDLEKIRGIDIRNASRALSPGISSVGLTQCLLELSSTYTDTMAVTFEFNNLTHEVEEVFGLAVYRICEQGFLNALTHGAAKNCVVRLWVEDNWVHVVIDNDGAELQGAPRLASGSAIIDAWVSSFSGTWSLRDLGEAGISSSFRVRLEAKLNLNTSQVKPRV